MDTSSKMDLSSYKGLTADQILEISDGTSTGHIVRAIAWIDLAQRTRKTFVLTYGGIELRYGIEQLVFELLSLHKKITSQDMREYLAGKDYFPDENSYEKLESGDEYMYKFIWRQLEDKKNSSFTKYAVLYKVLTESSRLNQWDYSSLRDIWKSASKVCHFFGTDGLMKIEPTKFDQGLEELNESALTAWNLSQGRTKTLIVDFNTLRPDLSRIWTRFLSDEIDEVKFTSEFVGSFKVWEDRWKEMYKVDER